MEIEEKKQIADEVRAEVAGCSDDDLFYFKCAIHSGEIEPEPLESVTEFISRAAREYKKNLPF